MKNVIFYNNESNSIVRVQERFEESIFHHQYLQALNLFQQMQKNDYPLSTSSNIIAFCGDRGEGKTSCMMSVKYILENLSKRDVGDYLAQHSLSDLQNNAGFEILDEIEPMFFDEKHDIRDLVLGRLYDKIETHFKSTSTKEQKRTLLRLLEQTKTSMKAMKASRDSLYDSLDELSFLSGGMLLQTYFEKLLESYLKMVDKKKLLLFIDDIDLNFRYAYEMMEYIRKYFNHRDCIIFLSCHIPQLENVINSNMKVGVMDMKENASLGPKYVTKLIPQGNRVHMPKVRDFCDLPLNFYKDRSEVERKEPDYCSVKEAVVRLIFTKTRYLFYNSKNRVSPIVPSNLRHLRQLLDMLDSMEDFQSNVLHKENKKRFKNYFFQYWTQQLNAQDQQFIALLESNTDVMSINKMVVQYLADKLVPQNQGSSNEEKDKEKEKEDDEEQNLIQQIIHKNNSIYNVSVGDVLMLINYFDKRDTDKEITLFLFFLKSFYSIRLYDYYDIVSETCDNQQIPNQKYGIYKVDAWFQSSNLLQRFVNGSFFTYAPGDIIPPSRDYCRDLKAIKAIAMTSLLNDSDKFSKMSDEKKREFCKRFNLFEYFLISLQRNIEKNKFSANDVNRLARLKHERKSSIPHYLKPFNLSMGYLVYDVLAPFYTLLNPEYTYNRFGIMVGEKSLYQFAKEQDWTLLHKMFQATHRYDERSSELNLLSDVAIRNAEIWSAMSELMEQKRSVNREASDNRLKLVAFFESILEPDMVTYPLNHDDAPHVITFNFLKPIVEFLKECTSEDFDQVFLSADNEKKETTAGPKQKTKVVPNEKVQQLFGTYLTKYRQAKGGQTICIELEVAYPEAFHSLDENAKEFLFNQKGNISKSKLTDMLNKLSDHLIEPLKSDQLAEVRKHLSEDLSIEFSPDITGVTIHPEAEKELEKDKKE